MRTLMTGASGMIGRELRLRIKDTVILSRKPTPGRLGLDSAEAIVWNPDTDVAPISGLTDVDAVIHLAGEPVADGRWTPDKKRQILDSRVVGTRNLIRGIETMQQRPRVLVSASAVGFYADRGDEILDEQSAPGTGFLADVCAAWEHEALAAAQFGVRVVCLRIGIVLAPNGGALPRLLTPFRMGVGGRLGSGRQWMPWIHRDDIVGMALHAIDTESVQGPMNAVAPNPVTNAEFTRVLGAAIHRPTIFPLPTAALRLMFGEMSEIMIASQRVMPTVAQQSGYAFRYADLRVALDAVLHSTNRELAGAGVH